MDIEKMPRNHGDDVVSNFLGSLHSGNHFEIIN